jgi:L-lactate dehydrogenase complex protein LldG
MGSREKILENVRQNQPPVKPVPSLAADSTGGQNHLHQFVQVLERIGGKVVEVVDWEGLKDHVLNDYPDAKRVITNLPKLPWYVADFSQTSPHTFENVDLAILKGYFGVAENGAVWITDELMGDRVIPFISQHLALVINKNDIVPTLYEAYEKIAPLQYNYGTFIAGPSKTADIEQSLVLGAHGPKSLVVFLMDH